LEGGAVFGRRKKSFSCFSIAAKNQSIRPQKSMENILELSNTVKQALLEKEHIWVRWLFCLLSWRCEFWNHPKVYWKTSL